MTRDDFRVFGEGHETRAQRSKNQIRIAAPEIGPTNAATKERVAGESDGGGAVPDDEGHAAGRVPRRVENDEVERARAKDRVVDEVSLHLAPLRQGHPKQLGLHG